MALIVLAAVALYESNDLVTKQFEDEANIVAQTAANEIEDQQTQLIRAANLIAGLPTTRELTEARDTLGLQAFLIPQKSRLGVNLMNVADLTGVYGISGSTGPSLSVAGVTGTSDTQIGVLGTSTSNAGVVGARHGYR